MTQNEALSAGQNMAAVQQKQDGAPKKKASWFRTILWILSMMFLANVVMAGVAYYIFFYGK